MDAQTERVVKLGQAGKENDCPVPGIHLEVKENLQVIEYGSADYSWLHP